MNRSWPFFTVVLFSFALGSLWGWRLIKSRDEAEGRFVSNTQIRLLVPNGLISDSMVREFEKQEHVSVSLTTEASPATLLRKLLKSAPGQFDGAFIFHHQLPALRAERKLQSLYDSRNRFPIAIAPDFRKLPDDRDLMETAPLLWGLVGIARRDGSSPESLLKQPNWDPKRLAVAIWPSWLTAFAPPETSPAELVQLIQLVQKMSPALRNQSSFFEATIAEGVNTALVTHGQLIQLSGPKPWTFSSIQQGFPLWILTYAAAADGNLELARKWLRFLLDPAVARDFVLQSKGGASTLRTLEDSDLDRTLKPSHLRSISIQDIRLDRDERVRQADELIEQVLAGAQLSLPARAQSATQSAPDSKFSEIDELPRRAKAEKPAARPSPKPAAGVAGRRSAVVEPPGQTIEQPAEPPVPGAEPTAQPPAAAPAAEPAAEPAQPTTEPSAAQPRDD